MVGAWCGFNVGKPTRPHVVYHSATVERTSEMGATQSNAKFGARGKGKSNSKGGDWLGYVDLPLTDAERELIERSVDENQLDLLELLNMFLEEGYKVSFAITNQGKTIVVTLTGKLPECPNLGYSLSGFGPDLAGALQVVWFKHYHIANGESWHKVEGARDNSRAQYG